MEPKEIIKKSVSQGMNQLLAKIQATTKSIVSFFRDKKNDSKLITVLAGCSLLLAIYFIIIVVQNLQELSKKNPQLINIHTYDTVVLKQSALTKNMVENAETLYDLVDEYLDVEGNIRIHSSYLQALQVPYTYLLQHIYLPSLNIWEDPYTHQINTDIIWLAYLQKNPYNDITLLQNWSDFFKNVWDNNESNEISDINIWNITEDENWYFNMPITVSFVANSKRAFLLLVDKLSMTSNRDNISLINEFFYYLRDEIKKNKGNEIKQLTEEYHQLTWFAWENLPDKVIAYHLYQWIYNNQKNILVDKEVIASTIKNSIACTNESEEKCYYQFREKYRNIPTFGYALGRATTDPAQNLKKFVLTLPPVFSIKEFTFDTLKTQLITNTQNTKYQGKVTIQVYGRWISPKEMDDIASVLGNKCFASEQKMSVDVALQQVSSVLAQITNINRIDKSQSDNLRELKANLEKIQSEYSKFSPYKKTIRLFEIYRMVDEAGLCK